MAATQKNFVVKNGIEIATDLIYATNDSDKVGFGTTVPTSKVDVAILLCSLLYIYSSFSLSPLSFFFN